MHRDRKLRDYIIKLYKFCTTATASAQPCMKHILPVCGIVLALRSSQDLANLFRELKQQKEPSSSPRSVGSSPTSWPAPTAATG